MSQTLQRLRELVARGNMMISVHGQDEQAADGILVMEILASVEDAVVVAEDAQRLDDVREACVAGISRQRVNAPVSSASSPPQPA